MNNTEDQAEVNGSQPFAGAPCSAFCEVDYFEDTPITDAFINHIDDSEIDIERVYDQLRDMERERAALLREVTLLHGMGEEMAQGWEAEDDDVPELMDAAVEKWRMAYPPNVQGDSRLPVTRVGVESTASFGLIYSASNFLRIFFASGSLISLWRGTASVIPFFGFIQRE